MAYLRGWRILSRGAGVDVTHGLCEDIASTLGVVLEEDFRNEDAHEHVALVQGLSKDLQKSEVFRREDDQTRAMYMHYYRPEDGSLVGATNARMEELFGEVVFSVAGQVQLQTDWSLLFAGYVGGNGGWGRALKGALRLMYAWMMWKACMLYIL
jgi:hypothetical protein